MIGFRRSAQSPPPARRINDAVIMRYDHVYEIDPDLMRVFPQQDLPAWDVERIVDGRWDHLAWMHQHFADRVVTAAELDLPAEYLGDDAGMDDSKD